MIDEDRRAVMNSHGVWIFPNGTRVFDLCRYLAEHPGFVRSREQIMDRLGIDYECSDNSVYSVVKRARYAGIDMIVARPGLGYAWREIP